MYVGIGILFGIAFAITWLWLIITKRGRKLIREEIAEKSQIAKLTRIADDPEDTLYLGEKLELILRISGYLGIGIATYFVVIYTWPVWIILIGGIYVAVMREEASKKRKKQRRNR